MTQKSLLDEKNREMRKIWGELYSHSHYKDYMEEGERNFPKYSQKWQRLQKLGKEIGEMQNFCNQEKLYCEQVKALFFVGSIHMKHIDYDVAAKKLSAAKTLADTRNLQFILPGYYILTCICLMRSYTEKLHAIKDVKDCYETAKAVLEGTLATDYRELCEIPGTNEQRLYSLKTIKAQLAVELDLQYAIMNNMFLEWEQSSNSIEEQACRREDVNDIFAQISKRLNQIEWRCRTGRKKKIYWIRKWLQMEKATFWSTKGLYHKYCYYGENGIKAEEYFIEAIKSFSEGYKTDQKNTICMGHVIALLEDCTPEQWEKVKNNLYAARCQWYPSDEGIEFEKKMMISKLREDVYKADKNNILVRYMEMRERIEKRKNRNGQNQDIKNRNSYPYLAVQYQALWQYFEAMDKELQKQIAIYDIPEAEWPDLSDIKAGILSLYHEAAQYIDDAMYNFEKNRVNADDENCGDRGFSDDLVLGHYTKEKILHLIIGSDGNAPLEIRNVRHLNDPSEGTLLLKYINDNERKRKHKKKIGSVNLIEKVTGESRIEGNEKCAVYMGSFTGRTDHLSMWSRYGDAGKGVCFCINAKESFDTIRPTRGMPMIKDVGCQYTIEATRYPLYMVLYVPRDPDNVKLKRFMKYAEARAEAAQVKFSKGGMDGNDEMDNGYQFNAMWWWGQAALAGKFLNFVQESSNEIASIQKKINKIERKWKGGSLDVLWDIVYETIMIVLDQVRFLVKDHCYRGEREFRVIQYSESPETKRVGDEMDVLYVKMKKNLCYEGVKYGPCVENYPSMSSYVLNMRQNNKNDGDRRLKAMKSKIPYLP